MATDKLIKEFRPFLDEAVILAIIGDYDLVQNFEAAREVLLALSRDVPTEEDTGFNPSGLSYDGPDATDHESAGLPVESVASGTGVSDPYTTTSSRTDPSEGLSDKLEALRLWQDVNVTELDDEEKATELAFMFPSLKELDIKFALKKAGGDFSKACEELLNTQYLEENGLRPKGINGAFQLGDHVPQRKNRNGNGKSKAKAAGNKVNVDYRLAPSSVPLDSEEGPTTSSRSSPIPRSARMTSSVSSSGSSSPARSRAYHELKSMSTNMRQSSSQSFIDAHQAWRRGKSDALYRPVAGILAERGREQAARARAIESETYDALVDEQSSPTHIDLHGVTVADGVRIALERTKLWWVGLGEERTKRAREEGFTIVTGLGTHSSNGVSRLRQEVGAALKREGWRVRTETGQFVVTGRQ
ncbi:hypothetical protein NKR23_g11384 [Pleurostoma richardsiae]|uniref:Smr domain-containing protein n=1 Tax=Pleurostoma richardsiae TaxID=41990 RepID=A0AA38R7W2_9PEZI|nr:hypothetical protein NKR23_g11384 [Pleurostoma richardsiae]